MASRRWCWLLGHRWGEWEHDNAYVESAPAYVRYCKRPWLRGHSHYQHEYRHHERKSAVVVAQEAE